MGNNIKINKLPNFIFLLQVIMFLLFDNYYTLSRTFFFWIKIFRSLNSSITIWRNIIFYCIFYKNNNFTKVPATSNASIWSNTWRSWSRTFKTFLGAFCLNNIQMDIDNIFMKYSRIISFRKNNTIYIISSICSIFEVVLGDKFKTMRSHI